MTLFLLVGGLHQFCMTKAVDSRMIHQRGSVIDQYFQKIVALL